MSWVDITAIFGNIGEFVGAIAVVFTLVYLAIQVRHGKESLDANTRALDEQQRLAKAQAYQVRTSSARDQNLRLAESDKLAQIIATYHVEGKDALSRSEYLRFEAYQRAIFLETDNLHFQAEQGYMDDDFIERVVVSTIKFWGPVWRELGLFSTRIAYQALVDEYVTKESENNVNRALAEKLSGMKRDGS